MRKRESISIVIGKGGEALLEGSKCWKASTVVGASMATCLPSLTALNAARMATSVLPIADVAAEQAVHRRAATSMSCLIVERWRRSWSSVSLNSKASSNSRCHSVSGGKAWPAARLARGVELEQLVGHVLHGLLHARLGLLPLLRAQPVQYRLHALRRAILLHQVESRERHIKPRAFGVLQDHELGGAPSSCGISFSPWYWPMPCSTCTT